MAHGTIRLDGHGFIVDHVPNYLDEECIRGPRYVFKTKGGATRRAASDFDWAVGTGQVVDLSVEQIDGFDGLWFVVFVYTPETAAEQVANIRRRAEADARRAAIRNGLR